MAYEKKYMERAIELAKLGIGHVNPNPLVGAVIVKDDEIIGEGYHHEFGGLHAERDAFRDAEEKGNDCSGAEMYVTLEPCCHTGKQPPCTDAIIEHNIKRVYVGSDDPNPSVNGKGIFQLRMNGIEVVTHVMKEECDAINTVFFYYIQNNIPYVMYKYAMTMDGKISTVNNDSKWITGEASRERVMQFRNEFMAIMVGIGTVLADDPMLNCRIEDGRDPIRIICDSELRIPMDSQIVNSGESIKTYIATTTDREKEKRDKIRELKKHGIGTLLLPSDDNGRVDMNKLMIQLGKMHIDSVMLEGGGTLAFDLMEKNLVNEIRMFVGAKVFGGDSAKSPIEGIGFERVTDAKEFRLTNVEMIDQDIFAVYKKD